MNEGSFYDLLSLFQHCQELRDRLNEARERLSDKAFESLYDSPFDEIICAAMDVEAALEECEGV